MEFSFSPEEEALRQRARALAQAEFAPRAAELDRSGEFPWKNLRRLAEEGFIGINIPKELGGGGLGTVAHTIVTEEIARADAATAVIFEVHNTLCTDAIVRFGTAEQKAAYVPKLAGLEWLGAFALTEPGAGSDPASQQTRAVWEGDGDAGQGGPDTGRNGPDAGRGGSGDGGTYVLNGEKTFITSGGQADLYVVTAVTGAGGALPAGRARTQPPTQPPTETLLLPARRITAFLVRQGTPGLSFGTPFHKMGLAASHTAPLVLDNVRVPAADRLGAEGDGVKIALTVLDGGRVGIAAQSLGIARAAFERALSFAKERVQFGRPIAQHQAIQWKLAEMAMAIDAAALLTYRAARLRDAGARCSKEIAMAKLNASRTANMVANAAQEILGARGYVEDYEVERLVREARVTEIYEGTSEIMKLVISGALLR